MTDLHRKVALITRSARHREGHRRTIRFAQCQHRRELFERRKERPRNGSEHSQVECAPLPLNSNSAQIARSGSGLTIVGLALPDHVRLNCQLLPTGQCAH